MKNEKDQCPVCGMSIHLKSQRDNAYEQLKKYQLSRLDHFAGLAMQGLLINPHCVTNRKIIANDAVETAKALIAELDKE